jgi:hypothetical protein
LLGISATTAVAVAQNSEQKMTYYNHVIQSRYDPYPYYQDDWFTYGSKLSDISTARHKAKSKLESRGHKIKFEEVDGNSNHNVGKCKHCGLSAGIVFIPWVGEFTLVGKAFDDNCSNKKIDTVSSPVKDKITFTPLKLDPINYPDPAVALPNQGFDIDMNNYPAGTESVVHDPIEHEYF